MSFRHRLLVTLVACSPVALMAQEPASVPAAVPALVPAAADSTFEIRLRDGSVFIGRIVERNETRVVVVTSSGTRIELSPTQIERIRASGVQRADGRYWAPDPNATRLFFSSTARPLAKGEGYVSSYFLFFPMVAYGITDRITLAAGTPILPGGMGELWYFAPKVTVFERDNVAIAAGMLGFWVPNVDAGASFGIAYGAGTFGSRDKAVTMGAGWGYFSNDGTTDFTSRPVFMIGGESRVSQGAKLISENWIAFDGATMDGFVTGGVRFIGDRLSADLGLGAPIGGGCCLPLVNFVYTFGQQKP